MVVLWFFLIQKKAFQAVPEMGHPETGMATRVGTKGPCGPHTVLTQAWSWLGQVFSSCHFQDKKNFTGDWGHENGYCQR